MIRPPTVGEAILAAQEFAINANCTRRLVGAVIWNSIGMQISAGVNKMPDQMGECLRGACPRGNLSHVDVPAYADYSIGAGLCHAVHAEVRAVMGVAPAARRGGLIAITDMPCAMCVPVLLVSELRRAVWPGGEMSLR